MLVIPSVAAAAAWRLRSGPAAAVTAAVVGAAGWIAAAVIEWLLSFALGA